MRCFKRIFTALVILLVSVGCQSLRNALHPKHTVKVERIFNDEFERKLISVAENAKPTKAEMNRILAKNGNRLSSEDVLSKWWNELYGERLKFPLYLNAEAIRHHRQMSRQLKKVFVDANGVKMIGSKLEYSAKVSQHESIAIEDHRFTDVYIVQMDLSWMEYCGPVCSFQFSIDRKIVFDRLGNILAIYDDNADRAALVS